MLKTTVRPQILLSSSRDLKSLRGDIKDRLSKELKGLSVKLFLWEEVTGGGQKIEPGSSIQQQLNELMAPGVTATIAMFGERIGDPLAGDPMKETIDLLAEWESKGLRHPWPADVAEQQDLLDVGCFPLTGTVYELLIALEQNSTRKNPLFIGYLSDTEIDEHATANLLKLNGEAWFDSEKKGSADSEERKSWEHEVYNPQRQGIINLVRALKAAGTYPWRFETEKSLARQAARTIMQKLHKLFDKEISGSGFKKDLSHFSVKDPLPFPDRVKLRAELVERFKEAKAECAVLTLCGMSGCGKSSLLQKGLLGSDALGLDNSLPLAVRPTDISVRQGQTPFQKLCHLLADFFEESNILAPGVREPQAGKLSGKIDALIASVTKALEANNRVLILGIDQFEEILDFAKSDTATQREKPESWWHVLHFIGRAAKHNSRIWIAATLESRRRKYPEDLQLTDRTGIVIDDIDVDFNAGNVRSFIERTASERGVHLAPDVIKYIDQMVRDYLEQTKGTHTSSFLPLLSLWMHRFYTKFGDWRHQAESPSKTNGPSLGKDYSGTVRPITMQDVIRRQANQTLNEMVPELVTDAWIAAGELKEIGNKYRIVDNDAFNRFIKAISQNVEGGAQLAKHCFGRQPQNPELFCKTLTDSGMTDIGGVEVVPTPEPAAVHLDLFLGSLVGVDGRGNMQLKDMPQASDLISVSKLIGEHVERRLLEPIARTNRVRLVHQSVVDNWEPAKRWFEHKKDLLIIEADLEIDAHRAGSDVDFVKESKIPGNLEKISQVLHYKRGKWTGDGLKDLGPDELSFRNYCAGVLSAARDGRFKIKIDPTNDLMAPIAYIAAAYDLDEAIGRWTRKTTSLERRLRGVFKLAPPLIDFRSNDGRSMLERAAWSSPSTVELLIQRGVVYEPDDDGWYPISAAIQTGQVQCIEKLLNFHNGPNDTVGPQGTKMLHYAASSAKIDALRFLLEKTNDLNDLDAFGCPPLQRAIIGGHEENTRILIEAGADCTIAASNHTTALHWAAQADSAKIVELITSKLSDGEKQKLIFERKGDESYKVSAIQNAARSAASNVLRALLEHADGAPIDDNGHPLLYALAAGGPHISIPKADRISKCVKIILEYSADIPVEILQEALQTASQGLKDAERLIINHIVLHQDDLTGYPVDFVLDFALDSRPLWAQSTLSKRSGLLDAILENGDRVDRIFTNKASVDSLRYCLAQNIEPLRDAELFRLEAALRICRDGLMDRPVASDQPDANGRLREFFPGVDPARLHPIIHAILQGHTSPEHQVLLSPMLGTQGRSLLHRLALRNELALFETVIDGLSDPLPLDLYGRLPSMAAPPAHRQAFEDHEASSNTKRIH